MSLPIEHPANLDFLDGYLFRVMGDILRADGPEAGFYGYYEARVKGGCALSPYDRMIFDYALAHFPKDRRIVHAGIGAGTLTSVLAVAGYSVAGIEQDGRRLKVAGRLRDSLIESWPDVAERYTLLGGGFPMVVESTPWKSADNVLIFTNCGAGWSEELTTQIIGSMVSFGDVVFDARLFGRARETDAERRQLVERVEAAGLAATPIAESTPMTFYYHVTRQAGA